LQNDARRILERIHPHPSKERNVFVARYLNSAEIAVAEERKIYRVEERICALRKHAGLIGQLGRFKDKWEGLRERFTPNADCPREIHQDLRAQARVPKALI
jgi:hypothetical protein